MISACLWSASYFRHAVDAFGDLLLLVLIFSRSCDFLADFEPVTFQSFLATTLREVMSVLEGSDVLRLVAVHCGVVPALCEPTVNHKLHIPLVIRGRVSRAVEADAEESDFVLACFFSLGQFDEHLPRRRSLNESS